MIIDHHKTKRSKNGFTLIELTVAMMVGLMTASVALTLFNQQMAFFGVIRDQQFMIREAPVINSMLNTLISKASALNVDETNKTLTLTYINPKDNSISTATIVFNNGTLSYQNTGGSTWDLTTKLDPTNGIAYTVQDGILKIKLTGPNGGEINYSTTPL